MNSLLIEVIVLITIGWGTTLYTCRQKWMRERQAWQWWQQQQTLQSHHSAESIRDGILQYTFAFRRYLESELSTQPTSEQTAHWLEHFQTFYHSLERLSNQLSPPFAADSLPLALQFVIKDWQAAYPDIALQFSLPSDWPHSTRKNQTVLSVVTGLLTLLNPELGASQQLQLTLSSEGINHALTLQLTGNQPETVAMLTASAEIQHLKEIFHSLAAGQLDISYEDTVVTSHLCWRDDEARATKT